MQDFYRLCQNDLEFFWMPSKENFFLFPPSWKSVNLVQNIMSKTFCQWIFFVDFPKWILKSIKKSRWLELKKNAHSHYGSSACVSGAKGRDHQGHSEVISAEAWHCCRHRVRGHHCPCQAGQRLVGHHLARWAPGRPSWDHRGVQPPTCTAQRSANITSRIFCRLKAVVRANSSTYTQIATRKSSSLVC